MLTLESAKEAFARWRASKANINTKAPVELWSMVEQLLPTHKRAEICKALGISSHQIKSYCTASSATKDQVLQPPHAIGNFVEAMPALNIGMTGMTELTLKGSSKSLHLSLPTSALHEVLPILGSLL